MLSGLFDLARPLLFALDPEHAHEATLKSLELGMYPRAEGPDDPALASMLGSLRLPNPVGIAAGFDKDARVPDAMLGLGCGFAEIGTVTPLPQSGNPNPRVFRLIADRAVINRLGFNNGGPCRGARAIASARGTRRGRRQYRRQQRRGRPGQPTMCAASTLSTDVASYFTINISSPNTPGLRDLQAPAALDELLGRVMAARARHVEAGAPARPIVVKIAPDIAEADLPAIAEQLVAHKVDVIAVSNTTLSRPGLSDTVQAKQGGGLSGRPLFHRSTVMLARIHQATDGRIPLIGIGGIDSGETALAKIEAGASLVQLYTGLIYEGPGLIQRIKDASGSAAAVRQAGARSIAGLVGRRAAEWAAKPLDG